MISAKWRFTVPKHPEQRNEDFTAISNRTRVYAMSDGASVSFDSASWSRIVACRFAQLPCLNEAWLAEAVAQFRARHNRDELPWYMEAAYDRGSFATLLGVRYEPTKGVLGVTAVGDSVAVLLDGERFVDAFPFRTAEELPAEPLLLSTEPLKNSFLSDPEFRCRMHREWGLGGFGQPVVLCMTDALAAWFLASLAATPSPISILLSIRTKRGFRAFVERERAAGRMKRDDTTLLLLA